MDKLVLADQQRQPSALDAVERICQKRWTIETDGKREKENLGYLHDFWFILIELIKL